MSRETKDTIYFWKKAKKQARDDGFLPGEHGYWDRVHYHFKNLTSRPQLSFPERNPPEVDDRAYHDFHGVEPNRIDSKRAWVPGEMVLLGEGVDVGYRAIDHTSTKGPGPYVHDFGRGVRAYRRARPGEQPDKIWSKFPRDLTILGKALGFSYRDDNGELVEIKGGIRQLATTPDRRTLVLVGNGVDYLIEGGNMHVADWIRD